MRTTDAVITVVVRIDSDVRPLVIWAGDRTRLDDRLVVGFQRYERRPHALDEARTRFKAEVDVPMSGSHDCKIALADRLGDLLLDA